MNNLFKEKEKLFKKSIGLRNFTFKIDNEEQLQKVRKEQDEAYKKCQFYSEFLKAENKINRK